MQLDKILQGEGGKLLRKIAYVAMAVFIVIDIFTHTHHAYFFWDEIPGFSSLFGFISCVVIIVVSKAIGKLWLQKKEDYYD